MSHAQNRLTFPSALQLATADNRENKIGQIHLLLTEVSLKIQPCPEQCAAIAIDPAAYPKGVLCRSRAQINLIKPSVSHANTKTCLVLG